MRLEEIFSQKHLYDYSKEYPVEEGGLSNLFPTLEIDGFETDYFLNQYNRGELATLSSFDVPATLRQREGFDKGTAGVFFFKDKYKLDEKEIMLLSRATTSPEFGKTIAAIYHDVQNLNQMAENRIEWMRYQPITTGKLVMEADNPNDVDHPVKVNIDFGVPEDHKKELDLLNESENPFEIIEECCDKIYQDTGFKPQHIITTTEIRNAILRNPNVRLVILGSDKQASYITAAQLNQTLQAQGLPPISVDDKTYKVKKVVKGKVKTTFVPFFDRDKFVFLPGGILGHTLRGITPEEVGLQSNTDARIESGSTSTLTYYKEVDPVAHYVKSSFTAGLTFPYADQIFIGTVKRS